MAYNDATLDSTNFQFLFLGKSIILNSNATGFASLQSPLQKAYFQYISQHSDGVFQTIFLRRDGVLVKSEDGKTEVHPYADIGFTDVIRFEVFKERKRHYGIFVCQSNHADRSTSGDAALLDPSNPEHDAIISYQHQPMIVCILRRSQGMRALECHIFAANSELSGVSFVLEMQHMIESQNKHKPIDFSHCISSDRNYPITENDFFRVTMHHLSKSQNLRPNECNENRKSDEVAPKSLSQSAVILLQSSQTETEMPRPKPRQSKLAQRTESVNILDLKNSDHRNFHFSRTKSLGHLCTKSKSQLHADEIRVDTRNENAIVRGTENLTNDRSEQSSNIRPVARVRPRIERISHTFDPGDHRHARNSEKRDYLLPKRGNCVGGETEV